MGDDNDDKGGGRGGFRFDPQINLGSLLVIVGMATGALIYIVNGNFRSEQSGKDLAQVQVAMSQQIGELRTAMQAGLADVKMDIRTIPDQQARLSQVEQRAKELSARNDAQDARLMEALGKANEAGARLDGFMRVLNQPLPGSRR